jgi:adenylate kinase
MRKAILLIGPTGSGKTPFGHWLEVQGIAGSRCRHFDFGENLRKVVVAGPPDFTPEETAFIREIVRTGALLEDSTFPLALRILDSFCCRNNINEGDILIMNGLPRHTGQAAAMVSGIRFVAVVQLQCSAAVVLERLAKNSGGDRSSRTDDGLSLVHRKLAVFEQRTAPLIDFYHERKIPILRFPIEVQTDPEDVFRGIGDELIAAVR